MRPMGLSFFALTKFSPADNQCGRAIDDADAFPAVTNPSLLNAGRSFARPSRVVVGPQMIILVKRIVPFFVFTSTGTISAAKNPASRARLAPAVNAARTGPDPRAGFQILRARFSAVPAIGTLQ